jgi:hypothetical protein
LQAAALQALAIRLIESGYDVPQLHDIAWDSVIDTHSAQTFWDAALPVLGWRQPSRHEAIAILLHHHSSSVVHRGADPMEAFQHMSSEAIYPAMCDEQSSLDAGRIHDMEALVQAFYIYDDLMDRTPSAAERSSFLTSLRRDITDWLIRHPDPPSLHIHIDNQPRANKAR